MTRSFLTFLTIALLGGLALPAVAQDTIVTADDMKLQATQAMKDLLPQDKTNTVFLHALAATYENGFDEVIHRVMTIS